MQAYARPLHTLYLKHPSPEHNVSPCAPHAGPYAELSQMVRESEARMPSQERLPEEGA